MGTFLKKIGKVLAVFLILFVLLSGKNVSPKNPLKIKGTVHITDEFTMRVTEVTLEEWLDFIINQDFNPELFPVSKRISDSAFVLLEDLKKGKDFQYIEIIKTHQQGGERSFWGEKRVHFKNKYKRVENADSNYFSPQVPVTGISFSQAKAFCLWREAMINQVSDVPLQISLPTIEMYVQAIPNTDSVNQKGCYLMNVLNCHCNTELRNFMNKSEGKRLQPAAWNWPDDNGLYNIQGNAAEMTSTEGVAMGGSFRQYARQSFNDQRQLYEGPEDWLGFRYVVTLKKYGPTDK